MNWVLEYAKQIKSGKIITSKRVAAVYARLAEEIKYCDTHKRSKYVFDVSRGQHPIDFIERYCKQSEGEYGAPIKLELFQKAFVMAAFGFLFRETGLRRFREVMQLIARKNGKTTLLAALALYMLMMDGEGAAKVYSVATKRGQAELAFNAAVDMRMHSPQIAEITKKRRYDIYFPATSSVFEALASQSKTMDGLNVHMAIIDELHEIRDPNLYRVIKDGTVGRRQPMIMMITTAGTRRENIYDQMYKYACDVADGKVIDEGFLPILYELDDREEWTNEAAWIKANPGLGTIKQQDALRELVERARNIPGELPNLLCKHFNCKANGPGAWLSYDDYKNDLTFTMEDVYDTYAIGGCDLSATTDLTCATLLIRKPGDEITYVLQHYFIPEERVKIVEGSDDQEAPYREWERKGLITINEGNRVDYRNVTSWFVEMQQLHEITVHKVGYDRALAGFWLEDMNANGFDMEQVVQGMYTWSQPMKELGAALQDKKINYNQNKILFWCMNNTGCKKAGTLENIQPVKLEEKRRIDGTVSLLNAYTVYIRDYEDFMNKVG